MLWSDLDWEEADSLAKQLGGRVPGVVERLHRSTPHELRLDFTRESLARLWLWAIDRPNRGGVAEADDSRMPPWYRFSAETCKIYGTQRSLVLLTDGVVSYLAACAQRANSRLFWSAHPAMIGRTPAAMANHPTLSDGDVYIGTFVPYVGSIHRAVVDRDEVMRRPGGPQRTFDKLTAGLKLGPRDD